ncbi:MAG: helix-turn-helix transcriptional regulator [Planctomycetes bacterium]|nr:helix-turn-helix transcriptional regulator [Planctomycetota bacterium]
MFIIKHMEFILEACTGFTLSPDLWSGGTGRHQQGREHEHEDRTTHIMRVSRERWAAGTTSLGRRPDHCTLIFLKSGSLFIERRQCWVHAPACIFSQAGEHRQMSCADASSELFICAGDHGQAFKTLQKVFKDNCKLELVPAERLEQVFQFMLEDAQEQSVAAHQRCVYGLEYISKLLASAQHTEHEHKLTSHQAVNEINTRQRSQQRFIMARSLIDESWQRIFSADEVAAQCDMTPTYLCRLFKLHGDCTPAQYLLRHRMRYAAEQLWIGHEIQALSEEMGYNDQFAFSKAFKRVMGEAPSYYLARIRRK